ncbi:MAG: Aspartate--tRNA(Asp/Asn) ligase [Nitrosopumilales archaeon]|nr:MAG: Aspartate--tRNA(Asp/Asn) ligase [Nitrosopumilales archaeon]
MGFERTHDIEEVNSEMIGQKVVLGGWIEDLRKLGKMTFLTMRDSTGITQIIVKGEQNDKIQGLNRQSVLRIKGTVQETKAKDFDFEVGAEEIEVLAKAIHPLPIDPLGRLESNIDNRLNSRALDMRNQKTASIFKLRAHVLTALREYLISKKFIEITTPKIIGSASEGGANLFSLEYFGKKAYLAQSPQLYKEQMTIGLERVFEIASFYRAEKSHTGRHLSEFTSVDIEAAFMDYTDVMDVLEKMIRHVYNYVSDNCKAEEKAIGLNFTSPKKPNGTHAGPFDRFTYSYVIEELNKAGEKLEFGDDLLDSHLRIFGKNHPGFYFITDWPIKLKPFYIMEKSNDAALSESFDLQFGYLELSSGGTRLHNPQKLKDRLEKQDLDPALFADHLKTFDWGMPPHAGWGLGLERLLTILIGIDNVREVILYPRDPDRLKP